MEAGKRRLLVVVLSDLDVETVREQLPEAPGEKHEVRVVAPIEISRLHQLLNDEDAEREEASRRAGEAAQAAEPVARTVDAHAGDADLLTAIEDELRTFPADEILVLAAARDRERMAEGDERTLERLGPPVSYAIVG
jgi:hypothetical protein